MDAQSDYCCIMFHLTNANFIPPVLAWLSVSIMHTFNRYICLVIVLLYHILQTDTSLSLLHLSHCLCLSVQFLSVSHCVILHPLSLSLLSLAYGPPERFEQMEINVDASVCWCKLLFFELRFFEFDLNCCRHKVSLPLYHIFLLLPLSLTPSLSLSVELLLCHYQMCVLYQC